MNEANSILIQKFFELTKKIARMENDDIEMPIEPEYEKILNFVLDHPEARADFANAFIEIVKDSNLGPIGLFEYCMHVLRWDEVRKYFAEWLEVEKKELIVFNLRKLLMVFDDDWYGSVLYERFNPSKGDLDRSVT